MQAEGSRCGASAEEALLRYGLRFAAEPLAVRAALRGAVARFARWLGPEDTSALELTLAEVLNNIVEHAYAGRGGSISLSIEADRRALRCRIVDQGGPMPGLTPPPGISPETLAAQRELLREGGWGWHIIRSLTRDLDYARFGDENRLNFRIDLSAAVGKDHPRS